MQIHKRDWTMFMPKPGLTHPAALAVLYSLASAHRTGVVIEEYSLGILWGGVLILCTAWSIHYLCPATYSLVSLLVPLYMGMCSVIYQTTPTALEYLLFFPTIVVLIGGPMSICLHRYFSHRAFETSRGMQFVIGLAACLAFQGDPLWWAAMHMRHHKHCDQSEDPHSVSHLGFYHAFLGWMTNPYNYTMPALDLSSLEPSLRTPEMMLLRGIHMFPPIIAFVIVQYMFGYSRALFTCLLPMVMCRLITLLFNVEYHPAGALADKCHAISNSRFLAQLVGESQHNDHHSHPRRAHRPDWDIPYATVLRPLRALGLIWDLK